MNKEYSIIEHNNEEKYLVISSLGHEIKIDYPGDILAFEELSTEELDIIVSGFIGHLEQYVAPVIPSIQPSQILNLDIF